MWPFNRQHDQGGSTQLAHPTTLRWTIIAFCLAAFTMTCVLIWQLAQTAPARWCGLAQVTSTEGTTACLSVLQSLITVLDHSIIGLLAILGMIVLGLTAVALGVRLAGSGPGGFSVDVGAQETKVATPGGELHIPTPPSQGSGN